MANYQPSILEEFADKLCREADELVSQYILGGVFAGVFVGVLGGFGVGLADSLTRKNTVIPDDAVVSGLVAGVVIAVVGALFGGVVGYYAAKEKALELRLKAQQTLCQLQIEKNTRKEQGPP